MWPQKLRSNAVAESVAWGLLVLASACSSSAGPAPENTAGALGASGQVSAGGAPAGAGSSNAGGGTSASGSSMSGAGGSAGLGAGGAVGGGSAGLGAGGAVGGGNAGTAGGDGNAHAGAQPVAGAGGTGGDSQSFSCTLVIGCFQTSQWFGAGFEAALSNEKWEIKADHNTFTENWANPTDAFWSLPVASACTNGATSPDRVLFVAYSKTLMTEAAWKSQLDQVVANVKAKFPTVRRLDLLAMVRAPNNEMCANNNNPSTIVRAEQDQAMQAVADDSGGTIKVGPKYFAPSCDSFVTNNTNLTEAAAAAIAPTLAAFYK